MRPSADRSYRWLFWCLALLGLALDQGSKYGVFGWLYNDGHGGYSPLLAGPGEHLAPWPEGSGYHGYSPRLSDAAFGLRAEYGEQTDAGDGPLSPLRTWSGTRLPHVNKGALFGVGNDDNGGDFNTFFLLVSLAAAVAIVVWGARRQPLPDRALCAALGLILAGTLGNLYDRIVFSGVRDFLHWNYFVNWPVFNIADCCLVCGAALLLLQALAHHPEPAASAGAGAGRPADTDAEDGPAGRDGHASAADNCGVL